MLFEGKVAEFYGNVQATQENSRLLCQKMIANFDRPVSLKEGNKGGQNPKVDNLMCDQSVEIEERVQQGDQVVSIRRLVAPAANMDNVKKFVWTSGPGEVRIFQLGSSDDFLGKPAPAGTSAKKDVQQEFKITHVRFGGKLQGTTGEHRMATFFDDVEVVHVPATRPDMVIDIDRMPPGGMYLHCEKLTVWTHRLPQGRNSQEMQAEHKVRVQTQEYYGNADMVTFDEAEDKVIFKGVPGTPAVLYKYKGPGANPDKITGQKIIYWRKANRFIVEDSTGLITN
jgi:lipopolysaccharide export system protein LptA